MDSVDYSVYKDCTPLFDVMDGEPILTGPQSRAGMKFGENFVPILQGLDNPEEKLVYFNSPKRSMVNPHDQFEEDLANQGHGLEFDIFPVWQPLQSEEDVLLLPQYPWEDNGFQFDEPIPQERVELETSLQEPSQDVLIAEEARNGHQVCQVVGPLHSERAQVQPLEAAGEGDARIAHILEPNSSSHTNMNGVELNVHECAVQSHQGLDQPIATGSDHYVVDEIPPGPSHASEDQEANLQPRRGRGRPRKRAAHTDPNSLTQYSSMRPKKRPDFVLPAGWTIKVITRKNGKSAMRNDKYYIEEETQHQCRSQQEVLRYLELKAAISLQEETTQQMRNEGH